MQLEELNLSATQITALKKKKIVSAEALLRKEPLHYYDFSKTYPLTLSNEGTKEMIEKNRPFAIIGTCVLYSLENKNHTKMVKIRIEDEATRSLNNPNGTYLFVNIMGYDVFRQSFLSEHPKSPHRLSISYPKEYAYYSG